MSETKTQEENVIGREQLHVDATVPQGIDNQFVSSEVFNVITAKGKDFTDPVVKKLRAQNASIELNRALVYTSQVVVNRAFFRNSEFLYGKFLSEQSAEYAGFTELLRSRAIVTYLFGEESATTDMPFETDDSGTKAVKRLFRDVGGDALFVRLSTDPVMNKRLTQELDVNFKDYFTRQALYDSQHRRNIIEAVADRRVEENELRLFEQTLKDLKKDIEEAAERGVRFGRNEIYQKWLVRENADVVKGAYLRPDAHNPLRFELKKLVDLRYNTNLPDLLKRTSFTPLGMPSRLALQDLTPDGMSETQVGAFLEDDLPRVIKEQFLARTHDAFRLPFLADLTANDLAEIRQLGSRAHFIEKQQAILRDPLRLGDSLSDYRLSFETFQKELSDWHARTKRFPKAMEYLQPVVSLLIVVAGHYFFHVDLDFEPLEHGQKYVLSPLVPDRIKGLGVKLAAYVYNKETRSIEPDYSYSLELMNSQSEFTRRDIEGLLRRLAEATKHGDRLRVKKDIQCADVGRK